MNPVLNEIKSFEKICILGFGKEGKSTYRFLRKHFPQKELFIADKNENIIELNPWLKNQYTQFSLGDNYLKKPEQYDLIIKSPGVKLSKSDFPQCKVTSQTEIFLTHYHDKTIGVTGTKGKSTTTSLINHILTTAGIRSFLAGNIGMPPFDVLDELDNNTMVVYELSAHQLTETTNSPHIAVLLNLFPEHLDFFTDTENYFEAKYNIFRYQKENDYAIFSISDNISVQKINQSTANKISFGLSIEDKSNTDRYYHIDQNHIGYTENDHFKAIITIDKNWTLKGKHNLKNIIASVAVSGILDIKPTVIAEALCNFKPLEHRLEPAGTYNNIVYYNDSIATIPEATIAALESIENVDTIILGGFDRGLNYKQLTDYICSKSIRNIILTGPVGKRLLKEFRPANNCSKALYYFDSLKETMQIIIKITQPGAVCLFSPAASSYDEFQNFEERGSVFKTIIRTN